jgi:hypothetical protein
MNTAMKCTADFTEYIRAPVHPEMNCTLFVRQYDILKAMGCFSMPKGIPNKRHTENLCNRKCPEVPVLT